MNKPSNIKELEEAIRQAFSIYRRMPRVGPKRAECLLGKYVIIPDNERSLEDIMEDVESGFGMSVRSEEIAHVEVVENWLRLIHGEQQAVVNMRCSGMGWKRIARELVSRQYASRCVCRQTLRNYFERGLDEILKKI